LKELLDKRLKQLEKHFKSNRLYSYDPYDGLNTPLRFFLFKIKILERVWLQLIKKIPFSIRKILGVKKMQHVKTISDLLSASSILYYKTGNEEYLNNASEYFSFLKQNRLKEKNGTGWGLRFYFTTRFVQANPSTPNLFNTVNSINSLLDYYRIAVEFQKKEIENLVNDGLSFIFNDLGFEESESEIVWNYWPGLQSQIFNVNALMAGMLSKVETVFKSNSNYEKILKTIEFVKENQNEDGSWYYSGDEKGKFIDGFHTGYILEGLCIAKLNNIKFDEQFFLKGVKYFLNNFFAEDNLPKYYNNSLYPIDGQNFAQIIQTLFYLDELNLVEKDFIRKVFERCDKELWNDNGYYNYMKSTGFIYKTPMDRWVNAPMYLAISKLF
jgi:hypothetical protein